MGLDAAVEGVCLVLNLLLNPQTITNTISRTGSRRRRSSPKKLKHADTSELAAHWVASSPAPCLGTREFVDEPADELDAANVIDHPNALIGSVHTAIDP